MSDHIEPVPPGSAPEAPKPSACRGKCEGYFYTVLNDEDVHVTGKPRGMTRSDAIEALKNALAKKHPCEPDDDGKCPEPSCICQPLSVPTSGFGAPHYTTPWKEEITAHIRWIPSKDADPRPRTVKGTVSIVKYHGEGICRSDAEEPPYHPDYGDEDESG
jgi:hypothetical protein